MSFVTDNHDKIFKKHISQLMEDIGRSITVYRKQTGTECDWCWPDPRTGYSSGKPRPGKVWSTHPNYQGNDLVCPNCFNRGRTDTTTTTTINNVIIQDISGEQYERGKLGFFKPGTKKLYGKLTDILVDSTDLNSETILQPSDSLKVVIDGEDHRVVSLNRLGIKTRYLFEAIVERIDVMEN